MGTSSNLELRNPESTRIKKMPPINYIGVNNLRNHNLYSVNTNPNPYFWGSVSLNLTLTLGWTCLLQVTNTLAGLFSLDPGL